MSVSASTPYLEREKEHMLLALSGNGKREREVESNHDPEKRCSTGAYKKVLSAFDILDANWKVIAEFWGGDFDTSGTTQCSNFNFIIRCSAPHTHGKLIDYWFFNAQLTMTVISGNADK